jgi:hypothetical protein
MAVEFGYSGGSGLEDKFAGSEVDSKKEALSSHAFYR